MLRGKRSADWDHTSLLILTIRKMLGDKKAKLHHPYHEDKQDDTEQIKSFKDFNSRFKKNRKK